MLAPRFQLTGLLNIPYPRKIAICTNLLKKKIDNRGTAQYDDNKDSLAGRERFMSRSSKHAFAALMTLVVYLGLMMSGTACPGICCAVKAPAKVEDHSHHCSHSANQTPAEDTSRCSGMGDGVHLAHAGCGCSHSGQNLYLQATGTPEVFAPMHAVAESCEVAPPAIDDSRNISFSIQSLRFRSLQDLKSVLLLI